MCKKYVKRDANCKYATAFFGSCGCEPSTECRKISDNEVFDHTLVSLLKHLSYFYKSKAKQLKIIFI